MPGCVCEALHTHSPTYRPCPLVGTLHEQPRSTAMLDPLVVALDLAHLPLWRSPTTGRRRNLPF